jgi:hypothetical protein
LDFEFGPVRVFSIGFGWMFAIGLPSKNTCEDTIMTDSKYDDKGAVLQLQTTDLYTISAKLLAIGELIKFRAGEASLEEDRVNYGLGEMLTDLANAIASPIDSDLS